MITKEDLERLGFQLSRQYSENNDLSRWNHTELGGMSFDFNSKDGYAIELHGNGLIHIKELADLEYYLEIERNFFQKLRVVKK